MGCALTTTTELKGSITDTGPHDGGMGIAEEEYTHHKRGPGVRRWDTTESFVTTPSIDDSHLSVQSKKVDLRVTPIISETHLLWGDNSQTPSIKDDMFRTFKLKPNKDDEWGMLINFTQHWSEWRIRKVEENKQGWMLGIRHNWYLVGVNQIELNSDTAVEVRDELMKGEACELHLSQEQPTNWKNSGASGTDVGTVTMSI